MIREFQIFGDLHRMDNEPSANMWRCLKGYCPGDLIYLQQERNLERIRGSFDNLPCPMNLYMLVGTQVPRVGDHQHAGMHVDHLLGRSCVQEDAITFVMASNLTGTNTLPFTPWIIAHRLMHAVQFRDFHTRGHNNDNLISLGLKRLVETAFQGYLTFDQISAKGEGRKWVKWFQVLSMLMTCKSARDLKLTNDLDIEGEVMAQVAIQGEFAFLPIDQWEERFERLHIHRTAIRADYMVFPGEQSAVVHEMRRLREEIGDATLASILRGLALEIDAHVTDMLLGMRGQVYCF